MWVLLPTQHIIYNGHLSMKNITNLQWSDRLALIHHFGITTEAAALAFDVNIDEVKVALALEIQGDIVASNTLDCDTYANSFNGPSDDSQRTTLTTPQHVTEKPLSATRHVRPPKKRGRKGSNISAAFAAIPEVPTNAEEFAKTHKVSISVLRQSKRFDVAGEGVVRVTKDKATKSLLIWRNKTPTS